MITTVYSDIVNSKQAHEQDKQCQSECSEREQGNRLSLPYYRLTLSTAQKTTQVIYLLPCIERGGQNGRLRSK